MAILSGNGLALKFKEIEMAALLFAVVCLVCDEGLEKSVNNWFANLEVANVATIERIESLIQATKQRVAAAKSAAERKAARQEERDLSEKLKRAKSGELDPLGYHLPFAAAAGDIGFLRTARFVREVDGVAIFERTTVEPVLNSTLTKIYRSNLAIKSFDASKLTTQRESDIKKLLIVTGAIDVGGQRIPLAEEFDYKPYADQLKAKPKNRVRKK